MSGDLDVRDLSVRDLSVLDLDVCESSIVGLGYVLRKELALNNHFYFHEIFLLEL